MIESFRHKGLRRFFEEDDRSRLPPALIDKIAVILMALNRAEVVEDMSRPGFRLHGLKGDLQGYWSTTVSGNWRIIFRFEDGSAFDVDFVDYH